MGNVQRVAVAHKATVRQSHCARDRPARQQKTQVTGITWVDMWRRGRDKSEICQKPLPINDLVIAGVKNSLPVLLLVAACISYSTHTLRLIKIVNCKLDVLGEIEF